LAKRADPAQASEEILSRLDILAEYRELGIVFASERPRSSGMIECYARGRDERKPSAAVNTNTGRYIDKGGNGESLSLFDFAAKYGGGRFKDWLDARKYYADKAGVKLAGGKRQETPEDSIDWIDWTPGRQRLLDLWCRTIKPGITPEAVLLAGARVGRYPCFTDRKSGERREGKFQVIALPCYGHKLLEAEPVAWVLWNLTGTHLEVFRGRDVPVEQVKMKSVGPTAGTLMNFYALAQLADENAKVEAIIKTGGPTDMLAVFSAVPEEHRSSYLVLTNASGETGDVYPHQTKLFAGRKAILVGDCDEAGLVGVVKWQQALRGVASEILSVRLPWQVRKKGGNDSRDYFRKIPADPPATAS
jgi:hypothetical protein